MEQSDTLSITQTKGLNSFLSTFYISEDELKSIEGKIDQIIQVIERSIQLWTDTKHPNVPKGKISLDRT